MPAAVFVDVDNTLYDLERSLERTLAATHAEFAADLDATFHAFESAYWRGVHGIPNAGAILERGLDEWRRACTAAALELLDIHDEALAGRMADRFDAHRVANLRPFPGVFEALERIAHERTLGVITNGPRALQRQKVDALGLARLVGDDLVIVSGEHPWEKPDAALFEEAARRAGVAPSACCMVGDSPVHDMPAAGVGYRTVFVNPRRLPVPRMRWAPSAVIETPAQLPESLDGLS